jgi:hypothetical protein
MARQDEWHLGQTSQHYETGGRGAGTISTGRGDHGGVSYGSYQLSTAMGTLHEYLHQSRYEAQFEGLTPRTPEFNTKWRELARTDPGFAQDQHDFIKRSHYDVQVARLKADGLDLGDRGPAVRDALWSTSVQFRGLTRSIFEKGLQEKFGQGYKLSELSDRDIVEAVQDYKINHNETLFSKSPRLWESLLDRARNEKADLVQLAERNRPLERGQHEASPRDQVVGQSGPDSVQLKEHMKGREIRVLQAQLARLGYAGADGHTVAADGDFGRNTTHAVKDFQQAHDLEADGIAGPQTLDALKKAEQTPLLSSPNHPDHASYKQSYEQLKKLDPATLGFASDRDYENAAASIAFEARISGFKRIDYVVPSANGGGLIVVQGDLDDPAHSRLYVDKAQAATQPLERSTVQLQQETQRQPQIDQQEHEQRRAMTA